MFEHRVLTQTTHDLERRNYPDTERHRHIAYAMLRTTVGVVFLFSGVTKFMRGVGGVAGGMAQEFSGTLPSFLVLPFAYALPFVEVTLGSLIVIGLFNGLALGATALLLVLLTFGLVMQGNVQGVAHNVMYSLVVFVLLWMAEYNVYSADRMVLKRR